MAQELAGYRVMVVEDEFFLAAELEDALTEAGAVVIGPIPDLERALEQVRGDGFDVAVLDINLGGDLAFPIADALADRGVPFLFASAYAPSILPPRHQGRRYLEKPFRLAALLAAIQELANIQRECRTVIK